MHILWTIIVGFVVGLVARAVKPGDDKLGIVMTTLLGIAGALVAKFVGLQLGWYRENEAAGFIAAVIGGVIVLFVYGFIKQRRAAK